MLALILAVISLSSIDPDPIVTPAAALHDRLAAGTGFASTGSAPLSGFTSDITVAPACTFGVPQFGSSLWNDAASFARLAQPACASLGSGAPWLPAFGSGIVQLNPALLRSATTGLTTTTYRAPLPARFTALPAPLSHGDQPARARTAAEPVFARAPGTTHGAERHH